jgi:hypothetical protein
MKTNLALTLALLTPLVLSATSCTAPETEEADPRVLPPQQAEAELEPLADLEDPGELPEGALAELMRIDDEQFRLEAEMSGIRDDADDIGWVQARLANMVAVDQLLRNSMMLPSEKGWDVETSQAFMRVVGPRTVEVDTANTHELKALVERHGWFNVSTFGADADRNGWLLVQHADHDRDFQRSILVVLEGLVPLGETSPSNYAYLFDRVASAAGHPQRYGTQGRCVGASWEPNPLEDPEGVDELRSSVGLGTLAEYKAICSQLCR